MEHRNTALDSLSAFAITFAAGVLSTIVLGTYIKHLKNDF